LESQDYPWGQQGGINAGLILLQPEVGIFEQMKSEAADVGWVHPTKWEI
jgi:hypothetical protein